MLKCFDQKNQPLVSVILPVYNGGHFISESILSILNQDYKNIELIVIDDGSIDDTLNVINSFSYDGRVKIISRTNKGLVYSLNEAIGISNGQYLARMDADDISHSQRISKQVSYLEKNKDVAVLGTRTFTIDENNKIIGKCFRPTSFKEIKKYFYFGSPLAHPSVVFNMNILKKDDIYYDENSYPAEDLDLFIRLSGKFKLENLSERLLKYRISSKGISSSNNYKQKAKSHEIRLQFHKTNVHEYNFIKALDSEKNVFVYLFYILFRMFPLLLIESKSMKEIFVISLKAVRRRLFVKF
ncbi:MULTISPECIES: glycosyltransferase [Vibrio]|uniref:glycosyltransferase n=1 Tax=Vibrio TaxID=662 RepID=UPI001E2BD94B|nr:glycosyltransferase [Vibrio cholerae]